MVVVLGSKLLLGTVRGGRGFVQHAVRFSLYLAATIQFPEVSIAHLSVMFLGILTATQRMFVCILRHEKQYREL